MWTRGGGDDDGPDDEDGEEEEDNDSAYLAYSHVTILHELASQLQNVISVLQNVIRSHSLANSKPHCLVEGMFNKHLSEVAFSPSINDQKRMTKSENTFEKWTNNNYKLSSSQSRLLTNLNSP